MRTLVSGWVVTATLGLAGIGLLMLGASPAAADTVTVTPSTGLVPSGQSVQISGTFSSGGPLYVVQTARHGQQVVCNTKAYLTPTTGGTFAMTIYVAAALRNESALGGRSDDPCPHPVMPGEPLCESDVSGASCTIELRRPGTGEPLASAPITFVFAPPSCSDFTTTTTVNRSVQVYAATPCSDPYKRDFAIEILDGPQHGTLGPPGPYNQRKYTPADRYVGPDEFTFRAAVGDQRSNVATMHLDVRGPDYSAARSPYFHAFHCGRFGRRSFEFGFRPAGGTGRLTPAGFASARYPSPFSVLTDADPARPHLSIYSGNSWLAYADTGAFAVPGNGKGCRGPVGPLGSLPRIAAPVKSVRASTLGCRFKSKFSYVGLYGTQFGGVPPTVRKAVVFEILVKRGHVKGYRTALTATLGGAHPSLKYDPRRCAR
jgi:hypothetical protein